jgi:hypothetical protein
LPGKEYDQVVVPRDGVIGDTECLQTTLEVEVALWAFVVHQVPGQQKGVDWEQGRVQQGKNRLAGSPGSLPKQAAVRVGKEVGVADLDQANHRRGLLGAIPYRPPQGRATVIAAGVRRRMAATAGCCGELFGL